jgi:hypothetical protein
VPCVERLAACWRFAATPSPLAHACLCVFRSNPISTMPNPVVFFDITIGGAPAGRIEMTVSQEPPHFSLPKSFLRLIILCLSLLS